MSSTPESVPLTRRIPGGVAIAVGVLVAIVVAVTLVVLPGETLRAGRTSAGPSNPTPKPSAETSQANVAPAPQTRHLGPRHAGAVVNGGPAAAVGNIASSPTVQSNPDQQGITSQLGITSRLEQQRGKDLPGWLLR